MNSWRLLFVGAVWVGAACAAEPVRIAGSPSQTAPTARDTVILTLPGAPAVKESPKPPAEPPAAPKPKAELPQGLQEESSVYLQHVIGIWKKRDAEALFGTPIRTRPAYDENHKVNGEIFAWPDPTGRYRDIELDFESSSGTLRTVFAYPKEMTWEECRKLWGGNVNTTPAKNGRMFYSYLNRKLDVLVDRGGKVISLGLY